MSYPAKPTLYKDIQFRSRLEARWAAFFDMAGWRWEYEPFDLPDWTPDFALKGPANDVLVEVKPIDWIGADAEQVLQRADIRKVLTYRKKRHDPERLQTELLVIGNGPQRIGVDWVLGAFVDESWGDAPDWAVLCEGDGNERAFDFISNKGAFAYRMGGDWSGNAHVNPVNDNLAERAWREAGNATQWKSPAAADGGPAPVGPLFREIARKAREAQRRRQEDDERWPF